MQRRHKGHKRYAGQRERIMTDPLILEGEYERAALAAERIASRARLGKDDRESVKKGKGELTDYD